MQYRLGHTNAFHIQATGDGAAIDATTNPTSLADTNTSALTDAPSDSNRVGRSSTLAGLVATGVRASAHSRECMNVLRVQRLEQCGRRRRDAITRPQTGSV